MSSSVCHSDCLPLSALPLSAIVCHCLHCLPLCAIVCNCLPLSATACDCLPLSATARHCLRLSIIVCNCLLLSITVCRCLPLSDTVCNDCCIDSCIQEAACQASGTADLSHARPLQNFSDVRQGSFAGVRFVHKLKPLMLRRACLSACATQAAAVVF